MSAVATPSVEELSHKAAWSAPLAFLGLVLALFLIFGSTHVVDILPKPLGMAMIVANIVACAASWIAAFHVYLKNAAQVCGRCGQVFKPGEAKESLVGRSPGQFAIWHKDGCPSE
jgi:hypothetical protein